MKIRLLLALGLELLLSSPFAAGAQNRQEAIDSASVQKHLAEMEAETGFGEDEKRVLRESYRAALEDLSAAEAAQARLGEFEQQRLEAAHLKADGPQALENTVEPVAPKVPENATLQQFEQLLSRAQSDLQSAKDRASALDEERRARGDRLASIPEELTWAREQLEQVQAALIDAPAADASRWRQRAERDQALARRLRLQQQIAALEAELASYDVRGALLTVKRDRAAREQTQFQATVDFWQQKVDEQRRTEEAAAKAAAEAAALEASHQVSVVAKVLEKNAELAEERADSGLGEKIPLARKRLEEVRAKKDELTTSYANLSKEAREGGVSDALGLLLLRQKDRLPDVRDHRAAIAEDRAELSQLTVRLFELEDHADRLADLDRGVREASATLDVGLPEAERTAILAEVRTQLQVQRGYVNALIDGNNTYCGVLSDLDREERALVAKAQEFRGFIDERVLWIRSADPPKLSDLEHGWKALAWLIRPDHWWNMVTGLTRTLRGEPWTSGSGLLGFLVLLGFQTRFRRKLDAVGAIATKRTTQVFQPTVVAFGCTVALALPWPALIYVLGWKLGGQDSAEDFARAVGHGLQTTAIGTLPIFLVRWICRGSGLAISHFDWPERPVRLLWYHSLWLLFAGGSALFVVQAVAWRHLPLWDNSLGRGAFVVGQCILALFVLVVVRAKGGVFENYAAAHRGGVLDRYGRLIYFVLALLPLVLAALSLIGYHYTAEQLFDNLSATLLLFLGLLLFDALTRRWLLISRRRLVLREARRRAEETTGGSREETVSEPSLDLSMIGAQTRAVQQSVMNLLFLVGLWLVWSRQLPAVHYLEGHPLWGTEQDGVTLADLVMFLIFLFFTVQGAKNLPGILELTILQRFQVGAGERYAITTLARYVIVIGGLSLAFHSLSIGWSQVQWLAAAITVGLGFGLQEIFANFVSGVILLFERPIRVGDTVTVGGVEGRVTRIRMRATTVLDWNRRELVIPNREFITAQLINWTLSDKITRVTVPVGVAYGSDVDSVESLLYRIAKSSRWTLSDPGPRVVFVSFGDSALMFELRVFIGDYDYYPSAVHDLHRRIDKEFRAAGIEISFPQRDLHVRSMPPIRVEGGSAAGTVGGDGVTSPQ